MSKPIHILFLCVANSARSQLAEGLAKSIFGETAKIESAGSVPSGKVQPWAIEVLKEQGIDISKNYSKSVDQISPQFINELDYVITLCAEEVCPIIISRAKKLHWPFKDPASKETLSEDEALFRFRQARDEIQNALHNFKKELSL